MAMSDIGYNLKYVRDNPYDAKIADMRFHKLVKELDRDHEVFMAHMEDDPNVDIDKLR